MENDSFEKKLKEISIPDTGKINPPAELKMTLLSAKKTTAIGIWLIAIPVYFLFCVFMKYYLHINLHVFDIIIDTMASIDRQSGFHYLSPLLLVGLPLLNVLLNSLAITHFNYIKINKELSISIKIKWKNIFLITISLAIAGIFLLYAIFENAHHNLNN